MLESRVGQARMVALTLALIVATGPTAAAMTRPASERGPSAPAAAAGDRIAGLAFSLGYDLERIFRFVADEIRYEPYAGILRGANGTLDAGAGNSLDQALLLAALLDESGIPYRYARGALDEAAATSLFGSSLMDTAEATVAAETSLAGGPFPAEVEIVPPEPAAAEDVAEIEAAAEAALEASGPYVADSVALITTALTDAGIVLGDASPQEAGMGSLPASERSAHTWLQASFGTDWVDLDPTLGTLAAIGETLAPPAETPDALPDELKHVVRFEVLLERSRGDRLETITVIEYSGFADELAGETITFAHVQPSTVARLGVSISSLLGQAQLAYHPILRIPGGSVVSTDAVAFGLTGTDEGGALFDDSGFFDPASPGRATLVDGEASAEWLAVTVASPGSEPVTVRRTVFDRVRPEVRYGGEPSAGDVAPIELIPLADSGEPDYGPLLGVDTFAVGTGPTNSNAMLQRAARPDADVLAIIAESYSGLRDVVAWKHALGGGVHTFVDRPGVASFSIDVVMVDDEPTLRAGLDIWHRSLTGNPTQDGSASEADANLLAGVVEHIAERIAMEAGSPGGRQSDRSVGVSRVFEAAAEAGVPTLVLHDDVPDGTSLDPMAVALIDEALEAGDTVIVPARPVAVGGRDRVGWWRVDPVTGATSDMMDDGGSEQVVEYSITLRLALCFAGLMPAAMIGLILGKHAAMPTQHPALVAAYVGIAALMAIPAAPLLMGCWRGRGPDIG